LADVLEKYIGYYFIENGNLSKQKLVEDFLAMLGELIIRGIIVWENYKTRNRPDRVLAREMGFKINWRNPKPFAVAQKQ